MSTLTFPLQHDTPASEALRTGIAVSATVAAFYALCTAAWVLAPGPFMTFMNSLFHGMSFNALLKPGTFSLLGFIGGCWCWPSGRSWQAPSTAGCGNTLALDRLEPCRSCRG